MVARAGWSVWLKCVLWLQELAAVPGREGQIQRSAHGTHNAGLAASERSRVHSPSFPDLNPLDYHVWDAMLEQYHELQLKPATSDELKVALQTI